MHWNPTRVIYRRPRSFIEHPRKANTSGYHSFLSLLFSSCLYQSKKAKMARFEDTQPSATRRKELWSRLANLFNTGPDLVLQRPQLHRIMHKLKWAWECPPHRCCCRDIRDPGAVIYRVQTCCGISISPKWVRGVWQRLSTLYPEASLNDFFSNCEILTHM